MKGVGKPLQASVSFLGQGHVGIWGLVAVNGNVYISVPTGRKVLQVFFQALTEKGIKAEVSTKVALYTIIGIIRWNGETITHYGPEIVSIIVGDWTKNIRKEVLANIKGSGVSDVFCVAISVNVVAYYIRNSTNIVLG